MKNIGDRRNSRFLSPKPRGTDAWRKLVTILIQVETLPLSGLLRLIPDRFGDHRGSFSETFRQDLLLEHGFASQFVQENQAFTADPHVLRGLHFQAPPAAQDKLIRVISGAVLDVAVDIRRGSPTFGQHVAVELSADNHHQLLVPAGFAHGYLTLTPNSIVLYKVTGYYAPQLEGGLNWRDEALALSWPIDVAAVRTNARDQAWPNLAELESPFA